MEQFLLTELLISSNNRLKIYHQLLFALFPSKILFNQWCYLKKVMEFSKLKVARQTAEGEIP